MSKKEIANKAGIHPSTLSRWIREGKVSESPTIKEVKEYKRLPNKAVLDAYHDARIHPSALTPKTPRAGTAAYWKNLHDIERDTRKVYQAELKEANERIKLLDRIPKMEAGQFSAIFIAIERIAQAMSEITASLKSVTELVLKNKE